MTAPLWMLATSLVCSLLARCGVLGLSVYLGKLVLGVRIAAVNSSPDGCCC